MSEEYRLAAEKYAALGIDTEEAIKALQNVHISMHCWQGDDVTGFENDAGLSGGILATGSYPGRARGPEELFRDIKEALSLIPGKHRVSIHGSYAMQKGTSADRDRLLPEHFDGWLDFALGEGIALDFNPTFFSHPMAKNDMTLSHPDAAVRRFWIDHAIACRKIAAYIGEKQKSPCLNNLWVQDGYKNMPADRLSPRRRLMESLDEIYAEKMPKAYLLDSVESKLFGIGLESYTAGSHEFYMNYALSRGLLCMLDSGHFHPTEYISDKIPAMLLFFDKLALHVTRPMRWDSDHVVLMDDELREIAKSIVGSEALSKALIGLDYFDASINRIAAWVIGMRNMQKALLYALLMPWKKLRALQDDMNFTSLMAIGEELKIYPLGAVWDEFCRRNSVPEGADFMDEVYRYEKDVLSKR